MDTHKSRLTVNCTVIPICRVLADLYFFIFLYGELATYCLLLYMINFISRSRFYDDMKNLLENT